ncbi:hypothetical protein F2Q68_00001815 [Brassica cretica]|uniref:Uncharacterized protein n=1 Tax=Brassica cretica TaxID=69181 RepID=A0A8S9JP26_BRACR|nr:hypothetical protein F2Q68_00001815 [Brassica cretica]
MGLACVLSPPAGRREPLHKAWLLAETAQENMNPGPHSVHSSFGLSLCSQTNLQKMKEKNLHCLLRLLAIV